MRLKSFLENTDPELNSAVLRIIADVKRHPNLDCDLARCELKTLEGLGIPAKIGGEFDCSGNKLTSLVGGPKIVGGCYNADNCALTTFEGIAHTCGDYITLEFNHFKSLVGMSDHVKEVGGSYIYLGGNTVIKGGIEAILVQDCLGLHGGSASATVTIPAFGIINTFAEMGDTSVIYDCQQKLIESGYEAFAEM